MDPLAPTSTRMALFPGNQLFPLHHWAIHNVHFNKQVEIKYMNPVLAINE